MNKGNGRLRRGIVWCLLLGVAWMSAGCCPFLVAPTPTVSPTPRTTSTAVTASDETFSPTSAPSPTAALPAYYVPHPALQRVTPPLGSAWHDYALRWIDAQTLRYRIAGDEDAVTWGYYDVRAGAVVTETAARVGSSAAEPPAPTRTPPAVPHAAFAADSVVARYPAPDSDAVLWLTEVSTVTAALPTLGARERVPDAPIFQGWLTRGQETVTPLFYAVEQFGYRWLVEDRYLLVAADVCYGADPPDFVPGAGLYVFDIQAGTVRTLSPDYVTNCEGSLGYRVAPGGRHLLYEPGLVAAVDGGVPEAVCGGESRARGYAWSPDGRFAYAACTHATAASDVLRRYDTATGSVRTLTDPATLGFRAVELVVSPDQSHLAVVWATSTYMPPEPYGVWIIDLDRLGVE